MKRYIIFTIDVEFSTHLGTMGIYGKLGNEEYGLFKLLDYFDEYNVKTSCFFDVYGYKRVGIHEMGDICRKISRRGHDIQLHTHPAGLFDQSRVCVGDYSLSEQIEIIKTGRDLIHDFIGVKPMAHRAGDWGANLDTMRALHQNGMNVDSSIYYRHPLNRFNDSKLPVNQVFEYEGITEIGPSIYHAHSMGIFHPFRNLDINYSTGQEFNYLLQKSSYSPLIVTLHSFSLLNWDRRRRFYWKNEHTEQKLRNILSSITNSGSTPVTIKDFMTTYKPGEYEDTSMVSMPPHITGGRFLSSVRAKITNRAGSIYYELKNDYFMRGK
jgi:peptidoglycan/xylan/chitin deacetylase (PgdA/CDA1 family)